VSEHFRVAIIGSGFGGLGMAIRCKQAGVEDFVVLEKADDVGGTWRENTYPGCRCDVPSHLYSFSFAPNPEWTSTFSGQEEIWAYLRRVTTEHGVMPFIRFGHEVLGADWDAEALRWRLSTTHGEFTAQVLIAAPGLLHDPLIPSLPGAERFAGEAFHSARWNHDFDLTGKRVAVIGTGASAIQFVPQIQPRVAELKLFQRTAPWVLPRPDRPLTPLEHSLYKRFPIAQRTMREAIYWSREGLAYGLVVKPGLLGFAARRATSMLERQVSDPELRRKLTPHFQLGCKRILIADDYYPALTQPNVEVVADGIAEILPDAIVDGHGVARKVDAIIYGTGFRATDPHIGHIVRGESGETLAETWHGSPQAYLGSTFPGFPNMFLLAGPNTGIGHTSLVYLLECQIHYAFDCVRQILERGLAAVDVRRDVWQAYNDRIQQRSQSTVWLSGCDSWYLDANGRNTTLYPDFTFRFRAATRRFELGDYEVTRAASVAA
jgi:cation diffusion facilitator CzcD-associated flavoprotein CzcO